MSSGSSLAYRVPIIYFILPHANSRDFYFGASRTQKGGGLALHERTVLLAAYCLMMGIISAQVVTFLYSHLSKIMVPAKAYNTLNI